ncbi:MBG domain-containing protein [Treponema sp. R6D11]
MFKKSLSVIISLVIFATILPASVFALWGGEKVLSNSVVVPKPIYGDYPSTSGTPTTAHEVKNSDKVRLVWRQSKDFGSGVTDIYEADIKALYKGAITAVCTIIKFDKNVIQMWDPDPQYGGAVTNDDGGYYAYKEPTMEDWAGTQTTIASQNLTQGITNATNGWAKYGTDKNSKTMIDNFGSNTSGRFKIHFTRRVESEGEDLNTAAQYGLIGNRGPIAMPNDKGLSLGKVYFKMIGSHQPSEVTSSTFQPDSVYAASSFVPQNNDAGPQVNNTGLDTYQLYSLSPITPLSYAMGGIEFAREISPTITVNGTYTYNGSAQTPAASNVIVQNGATILTNGTDYTFVASNSTNAGTATVTVTMKGAYDGFATQTFTINKAGLTITPVSKTKQFGEADPVWNSSNDFTFSGFVNDENIGKLSGTYSASIVGGTAGAGRAVGAYNVTSVVSGLSAANYNLNEGTGTNALVVNAGPASLWNPFSDVPTTVTSSQATGSYYWHYAVKYLWERPVKVIEPLKDTQPTIYSPKSNITRGDVIRMIWLAEGAPEPTGVGNGFRDIPETNTKYYKASKWCREQYIASGYEINAANTALDIYDFKPNNYVTRQEITSFICQLEKATGKKPPYLSGRGTGALKFKDAAQIGTWALPLVKAVWRQGIVSHCSTILCVRIPHLNNIFLNFNNLTNNSYSSFV